MVRRINNVSAMVVVRRFDGEQVIITIQSTVVVSDLQVENTI